MQIFTLFSIFIPLAEGILLFLRKPLPIRCRNTVVFLIACINSVFLLTTILTTLFLGADASAVSVIDLGRGLSLAFRLDTPAILSASLLTVLWPLTTVYGFSYIKDVNKPNASYGLFVLIFGIETGISCAQNFLTLLVFYAMMSFLPLPMTLQTNDPLSRSAAKRYLRYSLCTTGMILFAVIILYCFGNSGDFSFGGILNPEKTAGMEALLQLAYVLGFSGFLVKVILFPIYGWFQTKHSAKGSDTVLLYEIAIVNAVVFSVMRLTFFGFGSDFLSGSPAQAIVQAVVSFVIVFGSSKAARTSKLKNRLGYCTVSHVSYMLLAIASMTPVGLSGGLLYMMYHSFFKLILFFCAGAIRHRTQKEYIYEMEGLHNKMPVACFAFVICTFGLIGLPPLGGFISKLTIGMASASLKNPTGIIGAAVLIYSATMTVLYLVKILIRFYFPIEHRLSDEIEGTREANAGMTVPIILLCVLSVILSLMSAPLLSVLNGIGSIL